MGALGRGLIAGALGTATMDTLLFARCRRNGGRDNAWSWECSAGLTSWEQAPAPALVGKRLVEGLFGVELPPTRARLVNNVMHCACGVTQQRAARHRRGVVPAPRIRHGLAFGATVWASG